MAVRRRKGVGCRGNGRWRGEYLEGLTAALRKLTPLPPSPSHCFRNGPLPLPLRSAVEGEGEPSFIPLTPEEGESRGEGGSSGRDPSDRCREMGTIASSNRPDLPSHHQRLDPLRYLSRLATSPWLR